MGKVAIAICFKCGFAKSGALVACPICGITPRTNSQFAASLVLSKHLSSEEKLTQYSRELRNKTKLSVPREAFVEALEALKDPQLLAMLEGQSHKPEPIGLPASSQRVRSLGQKDQSKSRGRTSLRVPELPGAVAQATVVSLRKKAGARVRRDQLLVELETEEFVLEVPAPTDGVLDEYTVTEGAVVEEGALLGYILSAGIAEPEKSIPKEDPDQRAPVMPESRAIVTALHKSPFAVLGATTRDDRRRIVHLAEDKSLELDHDVCQKARADLTNPRTRLSAEMAWLPGVSPRKASLLLEALLKDPMNIRRETSLPTLAHLNMLAAAFEAVDGEHDADDLAGFIQEIAYRADHLDTDEVLRDINEDRAVSGFPEVQTLDQVEAELAERKRYYRSAIRDALDRLPTTTLVQVMTRTVDAVTAGGDEHAPGLIDDLVDTYEVETQGFLQKEAENIHKLIKAVRDSASRGEVAVNPYVDKLCLVARNWDAVAQPIQLSTKARGIDHEASQTLAYEIRNVAIDLFNNHGMLAQSQQLTSLLQELFAEVPEVCERVEQDADALADIFRERKKAEKNRDKWAREITYQAQIGVLFKDTLGISPDGLLWKGKSFPLDSVTRVRWGGVRHSVNGVPTGTTYTIAFGDRRSEAILEITREDIYSTFIRKLWPAVCLRLLTEMLEALKAGRDQQFGEALLHDDGITLVRHKLFAANEKVRRSWFQVRVWSADGSFCIADRDDLKTNVVLSYIHVPNTHILEQAIGMAVKTRGMRRLSDLLQ